MAPRTARRCPYCDAAVDHSATFCDQCGNTIPAIGATQILPVDRPPTYRGSPIQWVITIVVIGVVLGLGGVMWSRLSQGSSTVVNVAIATPMASATLDLSPQQTQVSLQQTHVVLQQTQVALQATKQPLAYSTPIAVPVLYSGKIPFSVMDNPTLLNPILGWSPGGSQASNYNLNPTQNELTLIAGSETWYTQAGMPMIIYPYKGDFDTEITVLFPVDGFVGGELGAYASGIGVKSTENIDNSLFFSESNRKCRKRHKSRRPYY